MTKPDGGLPMAPSQRGRRKLWVAAGVAGITGIVGLAALGGIAARDDDRSGADRPDAQSGVRQNVSDAGPAAGADGSGKGKGKDEGDWSGGDWSGGDDRRDGREHRDKPKDVPCRTDKLIQAIVHANANDGGVLHLAKGCTYELTRSEHGNGLPVIKESIVLKGHDTKIVRAATADHFRILNVGRGGHLTLKDVTVKGGQTLARKAVPSLPQAPQPQRGGLGTTVAPAMATPGPALTAPGPDSADGAGLLVQRGGHADLEHSTFVQNQAGLNGGGIANYGTTNVRKSSIERNTAGAFGGGVFNTGVLRVEESKIVQNTSGAGGGGIANGSVPNGFTADGGTVWVWKSTISHNRTTLFGGGVFDNKGRTTITQSEITDNTANEIGGGVHAFQDAQLALEHVLVARNYAGERAGGVGTGPGTTAVIERSAIKENVAVRYGGGGLVNDRGFVTLRDSEVVANQATGPEAQAGGIANLDGKIKLYDTKVVHNAATRAPGGIFTDNDGVFIDKKSAVKDNRPTNCKGSPVIPDNCFG